MTVCLFNTENIYLLFNDKNVKKIAIWNHFKKGEKGEALDSKCEMALHCYAKLIGQKGHLPPFCTSPLKKTKGHEAIVATIA